MPVVGIVVGELCGMETREDMPVRAEGLTSPEQLRLLQLLTRREVAKRQSRAGSRSRQIDVGGQEIGDDPRTILPNAWRLVPEGTTLHDWQRLCADRWMQAGRGTVKVATGGGKTLLALAIAERLHNELEPDLRVVVVVPTIPLMFQWYDELRRGNLPEQALALLGGGQKPPMLDNIRILVCVINSARKELPELLKAARWPERMLLVVDECHRAHAIESRRIFDQTPKFTLGLSATPEQDSENEELPTDEAYKDSIVGRALGPIIYDFTIKDSLAAGLLTPFEVWHIGLPLSPDELSTHDRISREISDLRKSLQIRYRRSRSKQPFLAWCQTLASRGTAENDAVRFIGLAGDRKRLLYRARARGCVALGILRDSVNDADGRAIVFHESIDEIESIFLDAIDAGIPVVLEHSQLPDSLRAENIDAFRRGVARGIISAKSLVEGFNVPSADLGVIVASSSSVRQRIQSLGRMLRRKPGGRGAKIVVLYVRDTEDEAIYEKADWENVIGAERNRYFVWQPPAAGEPWQIGLKESDAPPRVYRPPSSEIDASSLGFGDPYPAQPHGMDLKVDSARNLRAEDGSLVPASPEQLSEIIDRNPHRRARRTPAGHLIVRIDPQGSETPDWRYLGLVALPDEPPAAETIRFKIRSSSGRRVIALENEKNRGIVRFALGPDASTSVEAGAARDRLLAWVRSIEARHGEIREVCWDGRHTYWVEVGGQRLDYDGELPALEFSS